MSAIVVENLSKRYVIGHQAQADTLRDALGGGVRSLWDRLRRRRQTREEFWALRDISFKVDPGEVVGIIGRNGAGKSTLLKILSRITEPTTGRVSLQGRVASLLEVGTGFHPELSGRENIFLNGAILGMSRAEIRRKFDEIVAFSEVEKFLDTPVKRYSSGMYVRLAFAVAAHLEPEILIVDEVLAVGDVAFQRKCIGKMRAVSQSGRASVLMVSHNIQTIRELCQKTILMHHGRLMHHGPCDEVTRIYENTPDLYAAIHIPKPDARCLDRAFVTDVALEEIGSGLPASILPLGTPWRVRIAITARAPAKNFITAIGIKKLDGTPVQTVWTEPFDLPLGDTEVVFSQTHVVLKPDIYLIQVGTSIESRDLQQFNAVQIEIRADNAIGHYPRKHGVGEVLNSMRTEIRHSPSPAHP